jgi:chemotaxis protein MotA
MTAERTAVSLSGEELLNEREKMNETYAAFTTLTTIFPLLGMLGTVISLLNMTDLIGTEATGAFLGALTSTFWGIVAAIICKIMDTRISYKIEDNEKHMDYLFNPSKKQG